MLIVSHGLERGRAKLVTAVVLVGSAGCGAIADVELFGESNAALVKHLGEPCEVAGVGPRETQVEEQHPLCLPGYCVAQSGRSWTDENHGVCSCRCDGPSGTGPMCDCQAGFVCEELIKDFGNLSNAHLVGSYCVPAQ